MILDTSSGAPSGFTYTDLFIVAESESSGWQPRSPGSPRYGHGAVASFSGPGTELEHYFLGGFDDSGPLDDVERYRPSTDAWSSLAPMPGGPRGHVGVAARRIGTNRIWVVGGTLDESSALARLEEYDVDNDTWTSRADLPEGRWGMAAAWVDLPGQSGIHVFGGRESGGDVSGRVDRWDRVTDTWTTLTPMPTARAFAAVGVVGGRVHVVGGSRASESGGVSGEALTDVVEVYDPATDTWSSLAPLPEALGGPGGAVVNELLHVYGGRSGLGTFDLSSAVYRLSPVGVWTEDVPLTPARVHPALVASGGALFVQGGLDVFDDSLDALDELTSASAVLYVHSRD